MIKKEVSFKPTGVEWIPQIPLQWDFKRTKYLFNVNKSIVCKESSKYSVLSLSTKGVIKRDIESGMGKFPASFDGYQIVKPNSVLLCLFDMDVTPRVVGHVDDEGIVSAAYTNLIPKKDINSKYYYYYFLLQDKNKSFLALGTGIRITLDKDLFGCLKIPFPPLETQNTIVVYLDKKTGQIQDFIRKKEWLIELLEEERSRTIERLVTKGLNDNVNMKSSGNEWIGDIPEHWQVKRLGAFGRFFKGGGISRAELTEFGIAAILYGDIYTKYNFSIQNIINRISKKTAKNSIKLQYGNLLFTGSGETIEEIGKCVAFLSEEDTYAGGDVIIYRQNTNDSLFLSYALNTTSAIFQKARMSKGDIIVHTYASKLKNVYIALPPINEQKEIVEAIKSSLNKIESLIVKAKTEIEKIKEYQESLITNVVTGKLKVPELSKQ